MTIQCTGCSCFFDVEHYDYPIYCHKCQDYSEWQEEEHSRDLAAEIVDSDDLAF